MSIRSTVDSETTALNEISWWICFTRLLAYKFIRGHSIKINKLANPFQSHSNKRIPCRPSILSVEKNSRWNFCCDLWQTATLKNIYLIFYLMIHSFIFSSYCSWHATFLTYFYFSDRLSLEQEKNTLWTRDNWVICVK